MKEQARLAKAIVGVHARVADDKIQVARSLADPATADRLRRAVKPPDASKTFKKAGAVLLLMPDPITAIPGAALIGVGYMMKGREPLSIEALLKETRKTMSDLQEFL